MSAEVEKHERTDAAPRLAGLIAAAVALGIALSLLVAWGIFAAGSRPGTPRLGEQGLFPHGPEERTSIEEEWPKISAEVQAHLAGYGWVDRPAGIVRIPIEQAMARIAAAAPASPPAPTPGAP
jgi:hypothetical protein